MFSIRTIVSSRLSACSSARFPARRVAAGMFGGAALAAALLS
ncbi:alpha/beta hydrolase, partial [Burkholderia gladioli]|nr:alpha/beta hydrolase [Burkholderia gladioli]